MLHDKVTRSAGLILLGFAAGAISGGSAAAKEMPNQMGREPDTAVGSVVLPQNGLKERLNSWGLEILISNDGFGLGAFYRRELSPDLSAFANLGVSEAKDPREVDHYDPYSGYSYVPGKLNRFLVVPLMFGVQYRLFREDITETFRPYVNVAAGPALIYVMPYIKIVQSGGYLAAENVEYFSSFGKGRAHYTAGGFVGFGANFGSAGSNLFGINFRYYFTYLFSSGIPSLINPYSGEIVGTKKNFGGFFIILTVGTVF